MINWRAAKVVALTILIAAAILLFRSPSGIAFLPGLEEEVFGFVKMKILLALALGWVAFIFHRFSSV